MGYQWGGSSPHHHQGNGIAEASVKLMKALIAKTTTNGKLDTAAFRDAVVEFRNTPRANGLGAAQAVYGRPMRSKVVTHAGVFDVQWRQSRSRADEKAERLTAKAKERYNEHAKVLPRLPIGAVVRVQHPRTLLWDTIGEVIEQKTGRSYIIRTESGRVFWRNRRFIRLFHPRPVGQDQQAE